MKNHENLYKESLDKIQEVLNNAKKQGHIVVRVEDLENTFHELKETEDERIRNAISYAIGNSTHEDGTLINGVTESEAMAWLEKQGEQEEPQVYETEDGEVITYSETDGYKVVGSKFKVGDWVVDNYGSIWKIEGILNQFYLLEGVGGGESRPTIEWVDKTYHLWTLKDAKDGDVLVADNGLAFIYNGYLEEQQWPFAYGGINIYGRFNTCDGLLPFTHQKVVPATKEQRDLLFQKMKKAGYEWDAEKKEVKKIHVIDEGKAEMDYCFTKMMNGEKINPAWSEEDERMCNASIRACQYMVENFENSTWDYEDAIDWLKSLKNKVQPKQEWSEKDEEMFDAIIADIQFTQKTHNHEVNQVVYEREIDWLKSLKDRVQPKQEWSEEDKGNLLDVKCIIDEIWHCQYIRGEIDRSCEELESLWSWLDNIWQKLEYPSSTWKPSEEQIRALEYQVHSTYQGSWQYKASKELLEQLKKL